MDVKSEALNAAYKTIATETPNYGNPITPLLIENVYTALKLALYKECAKPYEVPSYGTPYHKPFKY